MNVTEILNTIHEQGVENEVFELLTQWMIEDRYNKMVKIEESEATIRAINKIVTQNKNAKNKMSDAEFYRKANEKFRDTIDIKKEGVNEE